LREPYFLETTQNILQVKEGRRGGKGKKLFHHFTTQLNGGKENLLPITFWQIVNREVVGVRIEKREEEKKMGGVQGLFGTLREGKQREKRLDICRGKGSRLGKQSRGRGRGGGRCVPYICQGDYDCTPMREKKKRHWNRRESAGGKKRRKKKRKKRWVFTCIP